METIRTAAPVQTPDTGRIVQSVTLDLAGGGGISPQIKLVQYDTKLPIVAVHLKNGQQTYALPDGAAANVRMTKTDGKGVYNPVYGISADRHTAYVEISAQMTACAGLQLAVLEIVTGDMIKNTPPFVLAVTANPLAEGTYTSSDEYNTLASMAAQATAAAGSAAASERAAAESAAAAERNAAKTAADAKTAKDAADKVAAEKIDDKLTQMGSIKTAVEKSASDAAKSAGDAAKSAGDAAKSAGAAAKSAGAAAKSAENARAAVEQATVSATAAGNSANQAAESAAAAERNATQTAADAKTAKTAADKVAAEKIDDKLTQMGSIKTAVEKSASDAAKSASAAAKSAEDAQKALGQIAVRPLTKADIAELLAMI